MTESGVDFTPDLTLDMPWGVFSYSDSGGGPPVILMHGNGRDRRDWEPVLSFLKKRRLIRIDFRGHGGSAVPKDRFTVEDLADDIIHLADECWLGRVDLVGHSLGGMIALLLLRNHPERIGKIALVEGWTSLSVSGVLGPHGTESLPDGAHQQIQRAYTETFKRWMPGIREHYWTSLDALDASDVLSSTSHPILEIYGDRGNPPPRLDALSIPRRDNIQVEWIKGGSHFPLKGHPKRVGELLRDFLTGRSSDDEEADHRPPPDLDDLMMRPR